MKNKNTRFNRYTIRKYKYHPKKTKVFLYGRLGYIEQAVAYCNLHHCYLSKENIKEKKCNYKRCKYKQEL